MNLEEFQNRARAMVYDAGEFIARHLKRDGLKCEDCQLVCIEQALREAELNINGVIADDMLQHNTIKVAAAGYNHGGTFDVFCCTLIVTDEQRDNNVHLDVVEKLAELYGIPDVRVRFDDADAMGAPILAIYRETGHIVDLTNLDDTGIDEWLESTAADGVREMHHEPD